MSGTTHNVFGIQVGVGITVAVRRATHADHAICYHRVPEDWRKEEKLEWLTSQSSIYGLRNADILPASPKGGDNQRNAGVPPALSAGGDACVTIRDRGYLPHWHKEDPETIYYVTFRLGDSLPATLLAEIEAERSRLIKKMQDAGKTMSPADRKAMEEVFSERIEEFLDAGAGACYLANPAVAGMMRDVLFHFDGERYDIHAWAIMPNHVHLLLNRRTGWDLSDNLHSIKSFSSKEANKLLQRTGKFWQRESYDHIVRSEDEYNRLFKYIIENPEKAGLSDWTWVGSNAGILPASPASEDNQSNAGILPASRAGGDACVTCWRQLVPDVGHAWLVPENADQFTSFIPVGTKSAKADAAADVHTVFKLFSGGVKTNRDEVVYDFDRDALTARVQQFIEDYNAEVDRWRRAPSDAKVDEFVRYDRIKWSETLKQGIVRGNSATYDERNIRAALYRPFVRKHLFFDPILNERRYQFPYILPTVDSERENQMIWLKVGSEWPMFALTVGCIPDLLPQGGSQCFPFYIYDEDGSNRRENITDWALAQFRERYGAQRTAVGVTQASPPAGNAEQTPSKQAARAGKMPALRFGASPGGNAGRMPALRAIEKWDIFYYVYGLLHHPGYRTKYADNLKRELPRIPFAPDFWAFSEAGRELAHWHLDYEQVDPYPLKYEVAKDRPLSYRVDDKMRLSKDKAALTVNPSLTLSGIPTQAFEYRLGNRSALEWVIDQYQVKHDEKGHVTSGPNRVDDPEYIVRLVGQVIRVSIATVRLVNALPQDFGG